MKININLTIKVFVLFYLQLANSQNQQTTNTYFSPQIKTPNVSDFVKYGNISSSSYTGELATTIPLWNIDIPNQTPLNISLSHVSSGFRPSKRNGLVGQNWFLNVGGAITREINGMPDDQRGSPQINGYFPNYTNGFIVGVSNKTYLPSNIFNLNPSCGYINLDFEPQLYANNSSNAYDSNNYEGDPDMFSFNFNGISGKFFMGNDGLVKVTSNNSHNLKVDLTELSFQDIVNSNYGCKPKTPSRIKITDENGNIYYFGGETKNLEYSLNLPNGVQKPVITSWFLYKIEYYTGYILNFNYRDDSILTSTFANEQTIVHGGYYTGSNDIRRDFVQLNEYYSDNRTLYQFTGSFSGTGGYSFNSNATLSKTLQKIAILESIQGENINITFQYSRQAHKFNTRDNISLPALNNSYFNDFIDIKLDGIFFNGKKYDFNYTYLGGTTNSRMFLNSLTKTGEPPHTFEYYNTTTLPQPITFGIDHWGFWNGKPSNTNNLIPYTPINSNGDFSYPAGNSNSTTRDPVYSYALQGQLKKIIYPTGGYSSFEYEPHSYSKRLESLSVDNFVPKLYNNSGIVGGIRIKKIIDFDGVSNVNEKEYDYQNSGILLKWPRYVAFWGCDTQLYGYIRSTPMAKNLMEGINNTYSTVKEKSLGNGLGNGYIITSYRDFVTNPDTDESNFVGTIMSICAQPAGLAKNYVGYFLNDRSIERGKPFKIQYFNKSNNLKKEILYEYNESLSRFNDYSTKLHLTGPFIQSNKIYFYQDYLSKETVKDYQTNLLQFVTTENNKIYNQNTNLIQSENTYNSNNELIKNDYSYLQIPNNNLFLLNKQEKFINNQKVFEKQIVYGNTFDATTNFKYLPKKISSAKFPNTNPNLEDQFHFIKYNNRCLPVEVKIEGGINTVYLWGYNKSLIIAKIENATYAEVATALNITQAQLDNFSEINYLAINNLRNNPLMTNSMITTYQHITHVGVYSITDPKNNKTTYKYDFRENLNYVLDNQEKVLMENIYHYKN